MNKIQNLWRYVAFRYWKNSGKPAPRFPGEGILNQFVRLEITERKMTFPSPSSSV